MIERIEVSNMTLGVDIPCPFCQHKQKIAEYIIRRGGAAKCESCGSNLTITPNEPDQGFTCGIRMTSQTTGTFKDFNLTVRADGVWQFGNENERAVSEQLDRDSDRAAAVIAGSMVEERLRTAILARCQHVPKLEARHFHPSGAFGSFSIAIDLALMFKIISREAYNDLVVLKNIRNAFAHRLDIKDFQTQSIADKCKNLKMIETHVAELGTAIGSNIVSFDIYARPRMHVMTYKERLEKPRERYLVTAQLFMFCFFPAELDDYPTPFI